MPTMFSKSIHGTNGDTGEKLMNQHIKAVMKFFETLVTTVNREISDNKIGLPEAELRDIQALWNTRYSARGTKNSLKNVLTLKSR